MSVVNRFDRWLGEDTTPREGIVIYAAIVAYYTFFLVPILFMVFTTFKPSELIMSGTLLPREMTVEHWRDVLSRSAFQLYFFNSAVVASGTTVVAVLFGSFAGYSISRLEYPGRPYLIVAILTTTMLPAVLLLLPIFVLFHNLGILNTRFGLMVAHTAITLPFATWLLKGYFDDIPTTLDDAAKMDGCNNLDILFRIIFPLARPGLVVAGFYTFVVSWNNYLFVSILATADSVRTLPLALQMFQTAHAVDWGPVLTAATVTMLPVILLFAILQEYLIEGLASSGMKG